MKKFLSKIYYLSSGSGINIFRKILIKFRGEKMFSLPRKATIEITWNCNLNCIICPRLLMTNPNRNMSLESYKLLLEKMPSLWQINFLGLGEPLMHPDFLEMIRLADSRGIKVTFTTNGLLFTDDYVKKLPSNVYKIIFSIDSPIPEVYRQIRGANLNRVIENLKKIKKARPDIEIIIQSILMTETIEKMHKMVDLAAEVKAGISLLFPSNFDLTRDPSHPHYLSNCHSLLNRIYHCADEKGVAISGPPAVPTKRLCLDPWYGLMISIEGDIFPCCFIYGNVSEKIPPEYYLGQIIKVPVEQYKMGNIFRDKIKDIWNSPKYQLLRKTILESESPRVLSREDFNKMRRELDLTKPFSYCKICLFRWNCAC